MPMLQESWSNIMAQKSLLRTGEWINQFGSRLAGSAGCRSTSEALYQKFKQICHNARLESFVARPSAFGNFFKIVVLLYIAGVLLILFNHPMLAALILTYNLVAAGLQFGYYIELYDWLYPTAECQNVSAVLEPRETATKQLVISGHHDAARELIFLNGNQKLYGLKILLPDAFCMLGCLIAWIFWGSQVFSIPTPGWIETAKVVLVMGIWIVFSKFSYFTNNVTPGAGDNLIASSMLIELAEHFHDPVHRGLSKLEHTRLIFVSFDAEEAGLRGSREWVRKHRKELQSLPTTALNIDSIYNLNDLQFLVSDLNNHVRLDKDLAEECVQIAHGLGLQAKTTVMRFGGGGTDAAELVKVGVHATTMLAMSTELVRDGLVYHTMRDTVSAIEPEAVSACLAITHKLAHNLDQLA